jgi:hypothetical protein
MHVDGSKLREHLPRERAEMEATLEELGLLKRPPATHGF